MTLLEAVGLFLSAIMAGAVNSVAGGGSFFTFPMLLFTGMNPIVANATNTMATWPGSVASVFAYRRELHTYKAYLPRLTLASLAGAGIGAAILLLTPEHTFEALIPYLLLCATLLFAFGGRINAMLRARQILQGRATPSLTRSGSIVVQVCIAIYGGYFGGGMGIMMLGMLSFMGLSSIHDMNALKTMLATIINGVAVIIFVVAGIIAWPQALLMMAGAMLGGYGGVVIAKRMPAQYVRYCVVVTGTLLTLYFFLKS